MIISKNETYPLPAKSSQSLNWKLLNYISDGVKRLFFSFFLQESKE